MAFKDLTIFGKPAFDTPQTDTQAHANGALSILGRTLQGVAAPFGAAYGNDFGIKQMQLQAQQDQADMEFQRYLNQQKAQSTGKQLFMLDENGQLQPVGTVPKGSQVVTNPNAPTADMKNAGVSADQARILWDDLKNQSTQLKGGYAGMAEMGKAFVNRGEGESAQYKAYTDSLPSSAVSLYRALTGDTRLSDSDAKARALPLLWNPSEATDLRDKKNTFIDRMIQAREKLLRSGKYKEGIIPLTDIKKAASQKTQRIAVGNKNYDIPEDQVAAFKKDMGIK